MEPFNYSINAPNPNAVFQQAFQTGNLMRQSQEAAQAQAMQRQQAERMAAALGQLGPNATPADYIGIVNQYPDLIKPLTERYQGFDAARRNALYNTGERAFALLRAGPDGTLDTEAAAASLERSADAFDNSNAPDIAQVLRDNAKGLRMDPGTGKHALGAMMAGVDAERFDKFGKAIDQGDTPFIKELVAEGLQPGTPEFSAALREKRDKDPYISVAGVGLFLRKDVERAAEGASVPASIPQGAINMLRSNPSLRGAFDEKYGAGSAARVLGAQ